ncbi:helix-turn-helix domain-containing protein [Listeria monocytogenes]|uniref:helix-turn-helix transcriptional regulator n=1 Tax=Listeria monocytogenes TaxID=1639 RepID=UPI0010B3F21B|nr:helix-turn-helix domain-containing protein [Listeria monocytogenes]EAC4247956.1 DNA-binding protein [Listeria monocytogenes]EAE4158368.1 DNA-binding protein [Listeria monocytogenes]EAH1140481.1 DNA-binding protein [Listeria monocytogenes]EIN2603754.1 helix-turn-helix domain-containing protein [Listeria monocytogenes]EIO3384778.1 helix-turn-helix domain-containing protein [Listeria monocytogenes]
MRLRAIRAPQLIEKLKKQGIEISRSKLYKMVKRNEIPYTKIGSNVFFVEDQIEEWIRNGGTAIQKTEVSKC